MSNFGGKGASLVLDIAQSEKGTIPPYNDELVRSVVDESQEHHRSILKLIADIQASGASLEDAKPDDAASILVHHQAVLRNKRALLVYLNERMRRVRALRWEVGTALPDVVGENLSHSERAFFDPTRAFDKQNKKLVDMRMSADEKDEAFFQRRGVAMNPLQAGADIRGEGDRYGFDAPKNQASARARRRPPPSASRL